MSYPITAEMVLDAIQQGAREGTLAGLANIDFSTAAGQAQAKAVLDTIAGKDFATQATLTQVLSRLTAIENTLTDGSQKMQLSSTDKAVPVVDDMELAVTSWDDLPGDAPLGATAQLIGTYDVRQFDGAQWVEVRL